jgi:Anaerobic ribonucleoside-triphosphate reductase
MTMNLTVSADSLLNIPGAKSRIAERGDTPAVDAAGIVLLDSERQPCEIWTRVMGYHRPVASFNTGKKGEHLERRFFRAA